MAERLLEKEVLEGSEVAEMVKAFQEGRELPPSREPVSTGGNLPGASPSKDKPKQVADESPVPGLPPKPALA